jgi:hypothetical protein
MVKRKTCPMCGQKERPPSPVELVVLGLQPDSAAPLLSATWRHLLDVVAERQPVSVIDAAALASVRAGCSPITAQNLAYAGVSLGRLQGERLRRRVSGRKCLHVRLIGTRD